MGLLERRGPRRFLGGGGRPEGRRLARDALAENVPCRSNQKGTMMLTERDARLRWCPFVKRGRVNKGRGGRCMASDCMAWRWISPISYETREGKGYCGLAGKPILRVHRVDDF